jgi:hypothetical protein
MTYTLKVRGAPGPMTAEYLCPVHGRFEAMVRRTEAGDPPDARPCPVCLQPAAWVISAPPGRVRATEVVRGKGDPAPTPLALDTRALGEGMPLSEWKARRNTMWRDHDYKQLKEER